MIVRPLQTLIANYPELYKESFIVIGGLEDGGDPDDRAERLDLVAMLEGLPKPFRILFCCRSNLPDGAVGPQPVTLAAHKGGDFSIPSFVEGDGMESKFPS